MKSSSFPAYIFVKICWENFSPSKIILDFTFKQFREEAFLKIHFCNFGKNMII